MRIILYIYFCVNQRKDSAVSIGNLESYSGDTNHTRKHNSNKQSPLHGVLPVRLPVVGRRNGWNQTAALHKANDQRLSDPRLFPDHRMLAHGSSASLDIRSTFFPNQFLYVLVGSGDWWFYFAPGHCVIGSKHQMPSLLHDHRLLYETSKPICWGPDQTLITLVLVSLP